MHLMIAVESDTISAVGYDKASRRLYVRFSRAGTTYAYDDVAETVFDEFLKAKSKGAFFYSHVRDGYRGREVTHDS